MIPAMIVMMGNFSAAATSNAADADYVGLREGFTQLARLIDTYSTIKVGGVSLLNSFMRCLKRSCLHHVGTIDVSKGVWQAPLHACGRLQAAASFQQHHMPQAPS